MVLGASWQETCIFLCRYCLEGAQTELMTTVSPNPHKRSQNVWRGTMGTPGGCGGFQEEFSSSLHSSSALVASIGRMS